MSRPARRAVPAPEIPMDIDPAKQTFVVESRELLGGMEEALLLLERDPRDQEALNAIFRAAHTIKGSAGVFGFDPIVAFTHLLESLLVDVRAGDVAVDAELTELLLACGDHVSAMLDCIGDAGMEL